MSEIGTARLAITVARLLTQAGAEVDVVLTRGGREFVGAITFEAKENAPAVEGAHALGA